MNQDLPEGKQMRLRSFYGFGPEEDGYVGWSKESDRDAYLRKIKNGDLLVIYGASSKETEKALRSYVLGFVQVEARPIRDFDKASPAGLAGKKDRGWEGKWTYGIPIRRAWRAEEKVVISKIAFRSYRPEAGQALAVHGANLDSDEIAQAMKIRVREINVYGEPPISAMDNPIAPLLQVFKPSPAFPGSAGERTSTYEDGETYLYLAAFEGDGYALVGRKKQFWDSSLAMKIGVSNALKRRCDELNAGIPPAAKGRWTMKLTSQPFPNRKLAEDVEELFKQRSDGKLESLGKEFFWGRFDQAESLFFSLPRVRTH